MGKVLLITVGGSPQPIITSVKELNPDRVIFFCSTGKFGTESQVLGKGFPCEIRAKGKVVEKLPNLPTYLELGDRFQAERDVAKISNPDDASECYQLASKTIRTLLQSYSPHDIIVDYTGGTKTMSLSLGMAGIDYGLSLYVTTASRRNIQSVQNGELPERVPLSSIIVERQLGQLLPELLKRYDYSASISQLANLLKLELFQDSRKRVRDSLTYCQAFEAWDRFEHQTALKLLESFERSQEIKLSLDFLKRVMCSRADIDSDFPCEQYKKFSYHGYEIVEDLLLNAERRAKQERYDDAVGRLYRALELLMQIHFKKRYSITTLGVAPEELEDKLSDETKARYANLLSSGNTRKKFGVTRGYELLRDFSDDPLGQLYKQYETRLAKVLKIRNMSLFAHGFRPINGDDYKKFNGVAVEFIDKAIKILCPSNISPTRVQFPDVLKLDF